MTHKFNEPYALWQMYLEADKEMQADKMRSLIMSTLTGMLNDWYCTDCGTSQEAYLESEMKRVERLLEVSK